MTPELQALETQLGNNQLSSYYTKQLMASLDDKSQADMSQIIQSHIHRYSVIPEVRRVIGATTDLAAHLQIILEIIPSAFFIISNDFYRESVHFKSAKLLQIAGIAATLTRDPAQTGHIDLMIDSLNPGDSLAELNNQISEQSAPPAYFPKIIFDDFQSIKKKYKNLVVTKNVHDLIDMLFCFQGLLQVFLKYYFELICAAKSDDSALHIDKLFSSLFTSLKYQEIKYWNNYSDSRKLQNELYHIVKIDSPSSRHPVLRKHIFDSLRQYNPIIKDARSRFSAPDVRKVQQQQLQEFLDLTIPRLAVLLETVMHTKGRSYLVYLLTQVLKSENHKMFELKKYLENSGIPFNKDLVQLVDYFVEKLSSTQHRANVKSSRNAEMGTVIQTAETLRKMRAKKLLEEREKRGGLTYDQVSKFMQEKLNKMYQRVKVEGALTQDRIAEYMAQFADSAKPLLTINGSGNKSQAMNELKSSANQIIAKISLDGNLSAEQANRYKKEILEKTDQLMNADDNQFAEIVEQIGVTLADASIHSDQLIQAEVKPAKRNIQPRKKVLTYDQVSGFLENRLQQLYKRVRKEGALTQEKIDEYLSQYTQAAKSIMVELPPNKKEQALEGFLVSTNEILNTIAGKGFLSEKAVDGYCDQIDKISIRLGSAGTNERTKLIERIGVTLTNASIESDKRESQGYAPIPVKGSIQTQFRKRVPKLTQDQVPQFLENYLKRLYVRVKKDGALTQDQISKYLARFADAAQQIVIELPIEERMQAIKDFKVSTDDILSHIAVEKKLNYNQVQTIRLDIHSKINDLDTDSQQERIEIVDQIGLILVDAFESPEPTSGPQIDYDFLKMDIIPYGLDPNVKLISTNNFFSFPFGDRKGPSENDWFNFHLRYLEMIVKQKKLPDTDYQKIADSLKVLPKIKYKKYFNIFPNDEFEETTFLAVYDLWQNKALDSLIVES